VHRDLKPENIFVTRDHTGKELLKIVDFGVAKLVDHDPPDGLKTRVGTVVGTPAYMSPEQVSGMDVDARTDLYALGVIMYELLAGSLPFEGSTPYAPRLRQPGEAVPPLPSSVPAVLSAVITQLLAFDRARRFASATETIFALRPANDALKRDPTPWVQLLPSQSAPTRPRKPSPMHAVDAALRRVIEQPEPAIDDLLIQGIRETSAPATGWDLDASTLELEELGPKTSND
jgi:serine/threonine protein kinase